MALICIRVHSPLFFCHFSTTIFHIRCSVVDRSVTFQVSSHEISRSESLCHFCQLRPFHVECPVLSYFVTFQLRPFHSECPDPGHGTKICVKIGVWVCQLINIYCLGCIVDFYSTSHLLPELGRRVRIFIQRCF